MASASQYVSSCGLLLLPIFAWNALLTPRLPASVVHAMSASGVSPWLRYLENGSRTVVLLLPFAMPLDLSSTSARNGLGAYIVGTGLYCLSWLALIRYPASTWARSRMGQLGPAYTPAVWLFGMALLGRRLYWGQWYGWWMYLVPSGLFLGAHLTHAVLGRSRTV